MHIWGCVVSRRCHTCAEVLPLLHRNSQPVQAHVVVVIHLNDVLHVVLFVDQLPQPQDFEGKRRVEVLRPGTVLAQSGQVGPPHYIDGLPEGPLPTFTGICRKAPNFSSSSASRCLYSLGTSPTAKRTSMLLSLCILRKNQYFGVYAHAYGLTGRFLAPVKQGRRLPSA